jgi:6,7-dimethyl-8-ribityllumazine synthase
MPKSIEGTLDAKGLKCALVASRYNSFVVERLIHGALDCLHRHGAADGNLTVIRVPGSFEIPQMAQRLATSKKYDAVICLGALVRGETAHYEHIAAAVSRGLSRVSEATGVPVALGVLTTESIDQAIERSGGKAGNRGWDAALSAIEMASLKSKIR